MNKKVIFFLSAAVAVLTVAGPLSPLMVAPSHAETVVKADADTDAKEAKTKVQAIAKRLGRDADFKAAAMKKDTGALKEMLVKNGAPRDLVVSIPDSSTGAQKIHIHIHFCDKCKRGPVDIDIRL
jgi:hypothetical protein